MDRKEIINVLRDYLNDDRLVITQGNQYPIIIQSKDEEFSKKQIQKCCDVASVFDMQFFITAENYDVKPTGLKIIFDE